MTTERLTRLSPVLLCALVSGCSIAPGNQPQWLEGHGFIENTSWIAASVDGVHALKDGRVFRYPGGWDNPWEQAFDANGRMFAVDETARWFLSDDGVLSKKTGDRTEVMTSGGGVSRFVLATNGEAIVISSKSHARFLRNGGFVDTACGDRPATAVALDNGGVVILDPQGKLWTASGEACRELAAPFAASDVSGTDIDGGHFRLAAIDRDGSPWLLREEARWEQLPKPIVYRPGRWPRRVGVAQIVVRPLAVYARSHEGQVFVFSDPR
ncbi:MAG TPA: hypothetical protein VGF45_03415 [Polyangia bacterium]